MELNLSLVVVQVDLHNKNGQLLLGQPVYLKCIHTRTLIHDHVDQLFVSNTNFRINIYNIICNL